MTEKAPSGPRSVAIVGTYSSGKTALLESLLFATGAISRKGTIKEGNTVGDASAEARSRGMSVEVSTATTTYLDEVFTFLDCPGSVEFLHETYAALVGVDAAVVVCDNEIDRAAALYPLFRFLDEHQIPYLIFVNKMDRASGSARDVLEALQAISKRPLVLRQVPIRKGEAVSGYIDLVHERAYSYSDNGASSLIQIPEEMQTEEQDARGEMLEALADFDDSLLEKLLEDVVPPKEEIYQTLHKDFSEGLVVPVLFGAAERENGVRRLLKALRHDVPGPEMTLERVGLDASGPPLAQVLKTYVSPHSGRLSLVRVWRGPLKDGATLSGVRVGSVNTMLGSQLGKVQSAEAGMVVALGRMEGVKTGDMLSGDGAVAVPEPLRFQPPHAVYAMAVATEKRADEVKLSDALGKIVEEDPSLFWEQNHGTHQVLLWGQGEIHLLVALDRLRNKYNLPLVTDRPKVPYKETIRKPVSVHGRHKKQSGGHGQFGDVHLDIRPLGRGEGFVFEDTIVGGVVPRQYIPAVETGVKDYMKKGPLGFPVVDVGVTLTSGSYHTVDSSEMAFQTAGRIAMSEGMPQCNPVLLEPIFKVDVHVPNEYTPQVQRLLSGRRGQILGFGARDGWDGWDSVSANLPQAELHDLIIELRSLSRGVGTYDFSFDHLQELSGRLADDVVSAAAAAQ
ncbi:MAG: elongation factor G [Rhodospirillaceae bacterium]|mgnify:CR=1 FL=1|nr:elongation factor G [Rhodospirillaceae bacterium]